MNVMFTQSPRAKYAALQIAAQSHDDGVNREAMNDYRAQGRCESHKQGTKYRDVVRHHLARFVPTMMRVAHHRWFVRPSVRDVVHLSPWLGPETSPPFVAGRPFGRSVEGDGPDGKKAVLAALGGAQISPPGGNRSKL
jgi:hypothetical protein